MMYMMPRFERMNIYSRHLYYRNYNSFGSKMPVVLIALLFIAAALSGCVGGERPAQPGTSTGLSNKGALVGLVYEKGNVSKGIGGASVILNSGAYSAATNANGGYKIDNIEPGSYAVAVEASGYIGQEESVSIGANREVRLNFEMTLAGMEGKYVMPLYMSGVSEADRQGVTKWALLLPFMPSKAEDDVTLTGSTVPLVGVAVGGWEVAGGAQAPAAIQGKATLNIWAKTALPALQVFFTAYLTVNGNRVQGEPTIVTATKDITGTDAVQFVGESDIPQFTLNQGDKIGIELWIGAATNLGGDQGVKVLCSTTAHPSGITLTALD